MTDYTRQVGLEEHDGTLKAKKVNIVGSTATVYAVVNTSATEPIELDNSSAWIGLASVNVGGSLPSINGTVETTTSKTLLHQTIAGNTSGNATLFVPTGTFKIVHLTLSAGATVGLNLLSGVTYLTGNASLNMTLFPGGGWVENGSIDAPIYDGLADASALVIATDTLAELAGKIVYYEV